MKVYNNTYCIYVHTNKINGKKYVGQTINGDKPNKRWKSGKGYKVGTYFYNAIQKYGWDNFEHEIIASNLTLEEANNLEKLLISKLDTINHDKGYNLTLGGEGCTCTEETKKKISKARMGKKMSNETKRKLSELKKGKAMQEETKKKISKANKGKKVSEKQRKINSDIHSKKVVCFELYTVFNSMTEAEKMTDINLKYISATCRGLQNSAGGYHWSYYNIA